MIDAQLRYARHHALPEVGERGQAKLREAHVLIVGLGGLGCLVAPYLAAAGVGRLTLVDFDEVSLSNLQRQPLYHEGDLGRLKVEVARERLVAQNAQLEVRCYASSLEELTEVGGEPALKVFEGASEGALEGLDLIIDATDRLATRDLICELSHKTGAPHVYGSVNGFEGQTALFRPEESCYRCLFPRLPRPGLIQSCAQAGVLGPAPALIGAAQAMLCLRALIGIPARSEERLTCFDLLSLSSYQLPLTRAEGCPYHGVERAVDIERSARALPISALTLRARLSEGWRPLIIDVRERSELEVGMIEGARWWPLGELEAQAQGLGSKQASAEELESQEQERGLDVVIYCAQGPRSERAAKALLQLLSWESRGRGAGEPSPLRERLARLAREAGLHEPSSSLRCWELVGGWGAWSLALDMAP